VILSPEFEFQMFTKLTLTPDRCSGVRQPLHECRIVGEARAVMVLPALVSAIANGLAVDLAR